MDRGWNFRIKSSMRSVISENIGDFACLFKGYLRLQNEGECLCCTSFVPVKFYPIRSIRSIIYNKKFRSKERVPNLPKRHFPYYLSCFRKLIPRVYNQQKTRSLAWSMTWGRQFENLGFSDRFLKNFSKWLQLTQLTEEHATNKIFTPADNSGLEESGFSGRFSLSRLDGFL